jgi:UDP-glucose 4-epimerase
MKSKKILVVGGAGYIGSHMSWMLRERGEQVVILDNLSSGHKDAAFCGTFIEGDLCNSNVLNKVFTDHNIEAVIHFASSIQVGESMSDPAKYYENNLVNSLNLLNALRNHGVLKIIFSSTAAIFGNPDYTPIDENHPLNPINTYGWTKLMVERILADYDRAYGIKSVSLRYFNAAGAHPDSIMGERHDPETHLIPLVLDAASGRRAEITVFGQDYGTYDGTCIRDYIHVMDLGEAHWLSLQHLINGGSSNSFNLGNGNGYSVNEVIRSVEKVTGLNVPVKYGSRRFGDPAVLVSDSTKIIDLLGWAPRYSSLDEIVEHAWQWHKRQADQSN